MSGPIPAELGSLANLQELSLWGNQLTGPIPPALSSLTGLEVLSLSQNQLSGPIPAELGSLTSLEVLTLWENQLTGPIPPALSSLTGLEVLSLSQNQLSGPIPAELGSLTSLEVLTLWENQLTGPIPSALSTLTNLEILSLGENQLTGPIPTWLGSLTSLQELYLWGNQLTGPIPPALSSLTGLEVLSLSQNQLSGPIPAELGSLANLQELSLWGNQLTGPIPPELGSLTKLEQLFLSGNQLTGCIPAGIAAVANNDLNQLGLPFCAGALGAPTISVITPGVTSLTVTWAAPSMGTGATIIAYDLRYIESAASDKTDANWTVVDNAWTTGSGALSYQISGLTSGTRYDVQARAVTVAGDGLWSATAAVTPATWGAIRSFSSPSVSPGGQVVVTITANGFGAFGEVVETLPPGFSLVASSLPGGAVTDDDREVGFLLFGDTILTYTVIAPSATGSYSFYGVLRNFDREEVPVGGALSMTVGSLPSVSVSRAAGSEDAEVRPGSPISLRATFSRPVSGFNADDITVGNGTGGNFAGSGAVYTFDVTPNDIGEVTVDISAGAAEDTDGNGNTAAPRFSLGITYDDDGDGDISKAEAISAIRDYFSGGLTKAQAIAVIRLYFAAPTVDAVAQYAAEKAGGPGAIYVGDINQLVGPAPGARYFSSRLGDDDGMVPLDALQDHLWLYESDYYQSLIERANLRKPTGLTSTGESIEVQHACINRSLLPCRLIELYWAPNLEARTNGQLKLVVSSFPELGVAGSDTLQLVSDGTLSMADIYPGYFAGELPAFEVQSLWGIYPDWETMYLSLTDMHPQLEAMVAEETGGGIIVNHNWYSGEDQFLFSKKALRTLADFEGLKTRSHSTGLSDWIRGMGAEAQFMAFAEVYTALERGILDAGVTGATPGYGQRWYEVAEYLNGPLRSLLSTNNVINADVWNDIPADLQQIFIEEGAKAELEQLRLTSIQNVIGVQKIIDAGMTLVEFSPELAEHSFDVAVIEHVIPGWLNRVGYPGKGDNAVATFNEHVGPYVGLRIESDGSVAQVPIIQGPHAGNTMEQVLTR